MAADKMAGAVDGHAGYRCAEAGTGAPEGDRSQGSDVVEPYHHA